MSDWLDDFEQYLASLPHARTNDPATSHEAVPTPKKLSEQALLVLQAYRSGQPLTDHKAYEDVGLNVEMNGARQRCTDLRHAGLIKKTGERGKTPSGKAGNLCRITPTGLVRLRLLDVFA